MADYEAIVLNMKEQEACDYLESLFRQYINDGKGIRDLLAYSLEFGRKTGRYPQWREYVAVCGNDDHVRTVLDDECDFEGVFYSQMFDPAYEVSKERMLFVLEILDKESGEEFEAPFWRYAEDVNLNGVCDHTKGVISVLLDYYALNRDKVVSQLDDGAVKDWLLNQYCHFDQNDLK